MVVGPQGPSRVGQRQIVFKTRDRSVAGFALRNDGILLVHGISVNVFGCECTFLRSWRSVVIEAKRALAFKFCSVECDVGSSNEVGYANGILGKSRCTERAAQIALP